MTEHMVWTLSVLEALTLFLGLIIVVLGTKAYRATQRRPVLWLTAGMAVMTLGAVSEGLAFQGLGLDLDTSHLVEAVLTLVAFAILVYSLYA